MKTKFWIFLVFGGIFLLASLVLAESSSSSTSTPLGGIGIILTIVMITQINKSEKIAIKEADDKRIGVAGWLLFFIGTMAIVGFIVILRIISDIIQLIIYGPSLFLSFAFVFTEFLDLVVSVASIVAAYYLWKIKPNARWLVIGVLVFDILVVGVNWLVSVDELYLALSFFTLFWDIIMIVYFLTSRRVKNTYKKNARIPKVPASSNKTVKSWIVYQAIMTIIIFVLFQSISWAETAESSAEYSKNMPCIEYCSQYPETDGYYFGYNEESGKLICQCQKAGKLIASATYSSGIMSPENMSPEIISVPYNGQDSLEGEYGVYYAFPNQYTLNDLKIGFESPSGKIEVYFVKSEEDFNKFMAGEDFNVYSGCTGKGKSGKISCTVSAGGIMVYNPNNFEVTYTLSDVTLPNVQETLDNNLNIICTDFCNSLEVDNYYVNVEYYQEDEYYECQCINSLNDESLGFKKIMSDYDKIEQVAQSVKNK